MQTPNTPENKAAFMACYYGQKILCVIGTDRLLYVGFDDMQNGIVRDTDCIELTSLSDISDEDASHIRSIIWKYPGVTYQ